MERDTTFVVSLFLQGSKYPTLCSDTAGAGDLASRRGRAGGQAVRGPAAALPRHLPKYLRLSQLSGCKSCSHVSGSIPAVRRREQP